MVSLNFCGLIKLSKKFTVEDLKKDLAVSCAIGTNIEVNKIWKISNIIEILRKKFTISILWTPKFHKIINSLLNSDLVVT